MNGKTYRIPKRDIIFGILALLLVAAIPGLVELSRHGTADLGTLAAWFYVPLIIVAIPILVIAYRGGRMTRITERGVFNYWYGSLCEGAAWRDVKGVALTWSAGQGAADGGVGRVVVAREDGSTFALLRPSQRSSKESARERIRSRGQEVADLCHGIAPHTGGGGGDFGADQVAAQDKHYREAIVRTSLTPRLPATAKWALRPGMSRWFFAASGIPSFALAIVFTGFAVAAAVGLADSEQSADAYHAAAQCPAATAAAAPAQSPQWCVLTAKVLMYYGDPGNADFGVSGTPDPRYAQLSGVDPALQAIGGSVDVEFYQNVPIINRLTLGDTFTATVNPAGQAASITYRGDTAWTPASPLIAQSSYTELIVSMALLAALPTALGALLNTGRLLRPGRAGRILRARIATLLICGFILYVTAAQQMNTGSSTSPMVAIARTAHVRAYIYPVVCVLIGCLDLLAARTRRARRIARPS